MKQTQITQRNKEENIEKGHRGRKKERMEENSPVSG